ncbi:AraC family transcriptional regulator [Konateibacter massiliensis]|uniref:AraC family transcriptional regulator n=1 Tax=Konateibacter massiliensis TaxID=2002841 RepID=UPI000C14CF0E|nr:AraC family transcriptional regulator [Konateibacter massiliensis]
MRKEYELDIDKKSKWKIFTSASICDSLPFNIEECGLFHAKSDFFTEGDGINNYLLLYTVSGEGYCNYRGNKQILRPNSAILINCLEPFYVKTLESEWGYLWMHFKGSSMAAYMDYIMEENADSILLSDDRTLLKSFEEILSFPIFLDMNLGYYISNNISNILTCMIQNKELKDSTSPSARHSTIISLVTDYIGEHYQEDITIEDFLDIAHLSKYYFIKIFKKIMGTTPYDYLINYRISRSKILLRTTDKAISEIAYDVGFPSTNNFIIQFKRNVGVTPNVYRKSQISIFKNSLLN